MRAYVRDLQTGEERYAKDAGELAEYLGRRVGGSERDRAPEMVRPVEPTSKRRVRSGDGADG